MRVALDVSAVPARPAGAGRYVVEIARRLPDAGVATTLVTRRGDDERWAAWSPRASRSAVVPTSRPLRLAYEATLLGRTPAARDAVWHGPHYTMPRTGSRPTVVTICDLTFFTNPEWHEARKVPFFRQAIRYAATHADVLLSISETTTRLLDELVRPTVPVVTAPLGVDLERFSRSVVGDDDCVLAAGLPLDRPYLFFLGTVEPRKGLDLLLSAFDELASRDAELELWVAGQAGWGDAPLDEALRTHRFGSRIRRLGYVDDELVAPLMRGARAVVYPSRGEGFGLPVLEALACGARVVTTRDTVMQEVAGEAAWFAENGSAGSLAGVLREVISTSPSVEHASAARARAEIFTWDRTVAGHRDAYELALTRGRARGVQ